MRVKVMFYVVFMFMWVYVYGEDIMIILYGIYGDHNHRAMNLLLHYNNTPTVTIVSYQQPNVNIIPPRNGTCSLEASCQSAVMTADLSPC